MEQEAIAALVAECGWSLDQELGVVSIRQQEANIRPKKILAKIDFESKLLYVYGFAELKIIILDNWPNALKFGWPYGTFGSLGSRITVNSGNFHWYSGGTFYEN